MNTIIIVAVLFLAIAFLYEMRKPGAQRQTEEKPQEGSQEEVKVQDLLTADEALPTQTGRFRVQQALKPEQNKEPDSEDKKKESSGSDLLRDDPDSPLPDPFDDDSN